MILLLIAFAFDGLFLLLLLYLLLSLNDVKCWLAVVSKLVWMKKAQQSLVHI